MSISYNGSEYTEDQFRQAVNALEQHRNVQVHHRGDFIQHLGRQYDGERDLYEVLGYKRQITAADYRAKFERQDIARRIVELPAEDTWKEPPELTEDFDAESETDFERDVKKLDRRIQIWNALTRADIACGIGEYSLLFMGLADGQPIDEDIGMLSSQKDIKYLTPFAQDKVMDWTLGREKNFPTSHERYNKPVEYTISFASSDEDVTDEEYWENVHWKRVIHISEGEIGTELKGPPRLQPVYNRLDDLEKVLGSSAEMFWSGADEKYHFNIDTDDTQRIDSDALDDLNHEVQNLVHDMEKAVKTINTDLEVIGGQEVDPGGVVDQLLKFISGATGIPKRILIGSERGELASSQDKANWVGNVRSRQRLFAEPNIVRPFIDRLQAIGVLPPAEYEVEWPNQFELTEEEESNVWKKRADAVSTLTKAKVFASTEDLFAFMKDGKTPDFDDVEAMEPVPPEVAMNQFERGQHRGEQE